MKAPFRHCTVVLTYSDGLQCFNSWFSHDIHSIGACTSQSWLHRSRGNCYPVMVMMIMVVRIRIYHDDEDEDEEEDEWWWMRMRRMMNDGRWWMMMDDDEWWCMMMHDDEWWQCCCWCDIDPFVLDIQSRTWCCMNSYKWIWSISYGNWKLNSDAHPLKEKKSASPVSDLVEYLALQDSFGGGKILVGKIISRFTGFHDLSCVFYA